MFGSVNAETVPLVAAFVKANATLRIADKAEFRGFKLQSVHIEFAVDSTRVEQKMMRRYREQRLCKLADVLNEKVLNILTGEDNCGLLFTDAFHKIADIFHSSQIGEEQVKLVDARNGISRGQQLVGHIRKHVEQQCGADIFARLQKSLYAEGYKIAVGNIGVTVEKFAFRAFAY